MRCANGPFRSFPSSAEPFSHPLLATRVVIDRSTFEVDDDSRPGLDRSRRMPAGASVSRPRGALDDQNLMADDFINYLEVP